ncbi:hypothetical protein [Thalassospira australica]|uniref:hypothetical protein n=1 Tax=Thalassospira australica TaxID=1528106 RepID=UPI0038510A17
MSDNEKESDTWSDSPINAQFFEFGVDTFDPKVIDFYSSPDTLDRLGHHEENLKYKFGKMVAVMIAIDAVMIIIYCNPNININIYGNDTIKIRGFIESATIISSLIYWASTLSFINFFSYSSMITKITETVKSNNNLSSNFLGHVFCERDFSQHILNTPSILESKSKIKSAISSTIKIINLTPFYSIFLFHLLSISINISSVYYANTFGSIITYIIIASVSLTNISAFLYFIYGCEMKFQFKLKKFEN